MRIKKVIKAPDNYEGLGRAETQTFLSTVATLSATLLGLYMLTITFAIGQGIKFTPGGVTNIKVTVIIYVLSLVLTLVSMIIVADTATGRKARLVTAIIVSAIFFVGVILMTTGIMYPLIAAML
ncbi:MAG: hypothetical protein ABIG20_02480 [archaeon]